MRYIHVCEKLDYTISFSNLINPCSEEKFCCHENIAFRTVGAQMAEKVMLNEQVASGGLHIPFWHTKVFQRLRSSHAKNIAGMPRPATDAHTRKH
jgi:hypothetical protein